MASEEFKQLREDLQRLDQKMDRLIDRPEYDANNKSFDLRISACENAIKTIGVNQASTGWRILGYIITLILGGGLVEIIKLFH